VILFEVKIRQIHVAAGQDVDDENILPFAKANLKELRSQVPVMPTDAKSGAFGVYVVGTCSGPVASFPFTSIEIDPPRLEV
jgi:hypothetical protein